MRRVRQVVSSRPLADSPHAANLLRFEAACSASRLSEVAATQDGHSACPRAKPRNRHSAEMRSRKRGDRAPASHLPVRRVPGAPRFCSGPRRRRLRRQAT